jgi:small subunit ribosomal protein S15e
MDKKGDKKDPKAAAGKAAGKDAKPAAGKEAQKPEKKEEKKEETAEDRRLREEREEAKAEKKLHKKEHQKHMHEAHAAGGNIMDDLGKKQIFKKFSYRGNDLKKLIDMNMDEVSQQLRSRQRRKLRRKMGSKYARFINKLLEAKKHTAAGDKPAAVKTHLRDCIVLPSMVQSVINIHKGNGYSNIEVKPEMIGYYLGEFAVTYKRVSHGKPGVGATHSSKFVPIK